MTDASADSNIFRALEKAGRAAAERLLEISIQQGDGAIEQRERGKESYLGVGERA